MRHFGIVLFALLALACVGIYFLGIGGTAAERLGIYIIFSIAVAGAIGSALYQPPDEKPPRKGSDRLSAT